MKGYDALRDMAENPGKVYLYDGGPENKHWFRFENDILEWSQDGPGMDVLDDLNNLWLGIILLLDDWEPVQ